MMTPIIEKVVEKMEVLPEPVQALVLAYAESLGAQHHERTVTSSPFPLRGLGIANIDPSEPALPADEWNAVRGVLVDDPY